jgi:hypothetical protein
MALHSRADHLPELESIGVGLAIPTLNRKVSGTDAAKFPERTPMDSEPSMNSATPLSHRQRNAFCCPKSCELGPIVTACSLQPDARAY